VAQVVPVTCYCGTTRQAGPLNPSKSSEPYRSEQHATALHFTLLAPVLDPLTVTFCILYSVHTADSPLVTLPPTS
jgi:hypothetical protein